MPTRRHRMAVQALSCVVAWGWAITRITLCAASHGTLLTWRERWASLVNERLAELDLDVRIDHRSFAEQFSAVMVRAEACPELVALGKDGHGRERFSSREMIGVERRLEDISLAMGQSQGHAMKLAVRRAAMARAGVVRGWDKARQASPEDSQIMLAHRRVDVRALSDAVRDLERDTQLASVLREKSRELGIRKGSTLDHALHAPQREHSLSRSRSRDRGWDMGM